MIAVVAVVWLCLAVVVVAGWSRLAADRGWRIAVLTLALTFSLVHQLLFATIPDDAYITFRYARNIADGYGPVFNLGETVEGYPNFLWVVLLALPRAMFGVEVEPTAVVLGTLCALGCVLAAYVLANRIVRLVVPDGLPALGVAAAVVTAGAGSLAAYGPSGLETPLYVLLVLTVVHALAGGHPMAAGVLVALAVMTRPDGLGVAVLAGLWLLVAALRGHVRSAAPAAYALAALVLLVPWTAWRVTYYEHALPAAIVAKSGGPVTTRLEAGWSYLAGFALVSQALLLVAAIAVALLTYRRGSAGHARSLVWLLFLLAVGQAAVAVAAGGDTLPAWRLLAPVPPLLAVAAAAAAGILAARDPAPRPRPAVAIVALAVCGLSLVISTAHPRMLPGMHDHRAATGRLGEIGAWLGEHLPPGTVVSAFRPGALAYAAGPGLIVVDVRGVTDNRIAREGSRRPLPGGVVVASDYDYVVNERAPAVAVDTVSGSEPRQTCGIGPAYAGVYQVATFRRTDGSGWTDLYLRGTLARGLVEQLDTDPRFDHVPCE